MAKLKWKSEEDKFEAIGYLAIPGVISSIEPTVSKDKKARFEKEYKGKFSDGYPYTASKYGYQFRIYLGDTDGCPDSLRSSLDGAYGNRLNNTDFIKELVEKYGFKFTREPQNSEYIRDCVYKSVKKASLKKAFEKGINSYKSFIEDLDNVIKGKGALTSPKIKKYVSKSFFRWT